MSGPRCDEERCRYAVHANGLPWYLLTRLARGACDEAVEATDDRARAGFPFDGVAEGAADGRRQELWPASEHGFLPTAYRKFQVVYGLAKNDAGRK